MLALALLILTVHFLPVAGGVLQGSSFHTFGQTVQEVDGGHVLVTAMPVAAPSNAEPTHQPSYPSSYSLELPSPPSSSGGRWTSSNNAQSLSYTTIIIPDPVLGDPLIVVEPLKPVTSQEPQGKSNTGISVSHEDLTSIITTTNKQGQPTIITEILVPTGTTDKSKHTVIGYLTKTEDFLTPPPAVTSLSTYSTFPSGLSWIATSVKSNTHDSGGFPVFAPWPGCWFCPKGSHGIIIPGLLPGVYPHGGPPLGLPTPFPGPLTIEPDGTPVYPPEDATTAHSSTTASSSSCTNTKTVKKITYFVSYGVNSAGTTTATSTTSTASSLVRGCSVTGVTTTVVAKSTDCTTCKSCLPYVYGDVSDTVARRDVTNLMPRFPVITGAPIGNGVAGRIAVQDFGVRKQLFPRRKGDHSTLAGCSLPATITFPRYPPVSSFSDFPAASSFFLVTAPGGPNCPAPRMVSTDKIDGFTVSPGGNAYATTTIPPSQNTPWVNSDHVYELSNLVAFFNSFAFANSGGAVDQPTCESFQKFFFPNRLQELFNQLPSNQFPDLAAMDNVINERKGDLFGEHSWSIPSRAKANPGGPRPTRAEAIIRAIQEFGMAASTVNMPAFVTLFQKTHQRIWEAFLGLDEDIRSPCNGQAPPAGISPTWASAYSTWMETFLSTRGMKASSVAERAFSSILKNQIGTTGDDQKFTLNAVGTASEQARITYPPEKFLFSSHAMYTLTPVANGSPAKRQACTKASGAPKTSAASRASTATTHITTHFPTPYCVPAADPDEGVSEYCDCPTGDYSVTSGSNPCPWTTTPPDSLRISKLFSKVSSSTSQQSRPAPASTPKPCHIHLVEDVVVIYGGYYGGFSFNWSVFGTLWKGNGDQVATIPAQKANLPVQLGSGNLIVDIFPDPSSISQQDFDLNFTYGRTQWLSTTNTDNAVLPHCNVGGWAIPNPYSSNDERNRTMDCYFACS